MARIDRGVFGIMHGTCKSALDPLLGEKPVFWLKIEDSGQTCVEKRAENGRKCTENGAIWFDFGRKAREKVDGTRPDMMENAIEPRMVFDSEA